VHDRGMDGRFHLATTRQVAEPDLARIAAMAIS
jgi:hypothetical protein